MRHSGRLLCTSFQSFLFYRNHTVVVLPRSVGTHESRVSSDEYGILCIRSAHVWILKGNEGGVLLITGLSNAGPVPFATFFFSSFFCWDVRVYNCLEILRIQFWWFPEQPGLLVCSQTARYGLVSNRTGSWNVGSDAGDDVRKLYVTAPTPETRFGCTRIGEFG